jgi:hypothetical protein
MSDRIFVDTNVLVYGVAVLFIGYALGRPVDQVAREGAPDKCSPGLCPG